jgi:hypothetical protein
LRFFTAHLQEYITPWQAVVGQVRVQGNMGTPWSQMLSPGTPIFPFEATGGGLVCGGACRWHLLEQVQNHRDHGFLPYRGIDPRVVHRRVWPVGVKLPLDERRALQIDRFHEPRCRSFRFAFCNEAPQLLFSGGCKDAPEVNLFEGQRHMV